MATSNLLGLDVGESKIGVARVHLIAKIPQRLVTLKNDGNFVPELKKIIGEYSIDEIVVGLPRNLSGDETKQSQSVRSFVESAIIPLGLPVNYQDETLSSKYAEERLKGNIYKKTDIDAEAAVIILEDYLKTL